VDLYSGAPVGDTDEPQRSQDSTSVSLPESSKTFPFLHSDGWTQ
jgi:hypothetical protein